MGVLLPNVTSVAAVEPIFAQLFGRDFGLINWVLSLVGLEQIDWQSGTWQSWLAFAVILTWRWTGYNALIYLASLQAVSDDLYEAADLDGASQFQQFRTITVPALRPTIIFTRHHVDHRHDPAVHRTADVQPGPEPTGGGSRQFQTLACTCTSSSGASWLRLREPRSPGPCS